MVNRFLEWFADHEVTVIATEITVVGADWAGTLDYILVIDGVIYLVDLKTARMVRASHFAQLAALGSAEAMMREVDADYPGAVEYETKKWGKTYWIEEPLPDFSEYAILHMRPQDTDSKGTWMDSFCDLKVIPHEKIQAAHGLFTGALQARHAERKLRELEKEDK
jgi:hypothetical protein